MLDKLFKLISYTINIGFQVIFIFLGLMVVIPVVILLSPFALVGYLLGIKEINNVEEGW